MFDFVTATVSVLINTCREKKGSYVNILDYIGKEKTQRVVMVVVLPMMVVVVREMDVSMEHRNVISIRLIQTLD
jgi:hypothetical protein